MLAAAMSGTSSDASTTSSNDRRSAVERALEIITDVRAGEGPTALMLTLNVFLLLTAYYVIKPVREGLILAMKAGPEYKSYLSAATALCLLVVVPAYARLAGRVQKHRLVVGVTLFFASHLVVFWALSRIPRLENDLGFVFYVWVSIFNMMVVAQFWAFANDLYTEDQGKRLFALIGIGTSLGAATGAYITNFLRATLGLSVYELLLVSALLLVGCAALTQMAYLREKARKEAPPAEHPFRGATPEGKDKESEKKDGSGAFGLVLGNKYLLAIAIFTVAFTFVNTNGEYMLSVLVKNNAKDAARALGIVAPDAVASFTKGYGTTFYGRFFLWVNVLGVVIQTFAVSRIVRVGGLRIAFFVLPVIALVDATLLLTLPALFALSELGVLRPGKIAENATDYSLNNTVRNMLWLPTTTEMKYKAKQAIDAFFVRIGDVGSAAVVYFGGERLHWPVRNFAMVNVGLVAVWLVVAASIVRQYNAMTKDAPAKDAPAKA